MRRNIKIASADPQENYLKWINIAMLAILFLMVGGYFTWSENVGLTRMIKVVSRIGMTLAIIFLHQNIISRGAVASFSWKNAGSPLLYLAYLLLGFASFLWSTKVSYSALQWFMDVESLVFSFFFIKSFILLDDYFPQNKIKFYNLVGNTVFLLIFIFIIGMFVNPDDFFRLVEGGESKRLGGYIMNPNELGMLCGVGISSLIFDLYRKKDKKWTLTKILILVYALILTKSRSSLIGLLLIVFFHIRKSSNKRLKMLTYLGSLLIIPVAVEKMIMRKGGLEEVLSMTGRMPFWKALITEGLPREPWFGFGFMRIDYKDHFESVHTYAGHMTHNTFIQVLMNLGFIGFVIAMTQLFLTMVGFLREKEEENKLMLLGILIPVIINSLTEFGIFGETNYGILFYQLLIFSISIKSSRFLSKRERIFMLKRRPDWKPS
ncbi:MAG: O-antigen ligase family protein [Saprospiraceae bacterium]|nr:O-antigen ligase family protein [Saprospiraceae bacterium]